MRIRAIAGVGVAVVVLGGAWALVAPQELGGPVSYVVIFGTSMEPSLHAGDLVGVREGSDYGVGDVVAYDNKDIDQVVLHRIIRRAGERYVFQGDNNTFIDPYRATEAEIIGERWFSAAGAGTVLKRLQAPLPAGILAGVVGLLAFGGVGARNSKRGGVQTMTETATPHRGSESPRRSVSPKTVAAAFALALVLIGSAAAFTFSHPDTEIATTRIRYEQVGEFGYSAPAPTGPVYEEDVTTGDPIFLNVLTEIDVALGYGFETDAQHEVAGSASIEARLSGPNGWRRTLQVTDAAPISEGGSVTGTVDLAELRRSIVQVERITQVEQQAYELQLVAPMTMEGTVAGTQVDETFEPKIRFALDEQQLQLQQPADVEAPSAGTPVVSKKAGSVTTAAPVPARLDVLGRSIDLELARIALLIGLSICFLGLLITGVPLLRALKRDEPSRIRARYGSQLVSARVTDLSRSHAMVEVESIEALARLAERFDLPILCDESGNRPRYILEGGAAVYVYDCREEPPAAEPDAEKVGTETAT